MNNISADQHRRACEVDLDDWLLQNHEDDVSLQYNSVTLNDDDNVAVGPGFHGFINFATGKTGNNIDFLVDYLGYSYRDAVLALTGDDDGDEDTPWRVPDITKNNLAFPITITLPERAKTYRNLYAYLSQRRKIPTYVIQDLINKGIIYQEAEHNNIVFVTPEHDYYELRGVNAWADKRCRHRKKCPNYEYGDYEWCDNMSTCFEYKSDAFHGCNKTDSSRFWYYLPDDKPVEAVYICEAAIDAISLYCIHQQHHMTTPAAYVSIGGVANQAAINRIKCRKDNVIIATDNDDAGNTCRQKNSEIASIVPVWKDWNEDLQKGEYYGSKHSK